LILLFAAALAAAAPAAAAPCPNVVTPEALVCRALAEQNSGDSTAAAQNFEQAALSASEKDGSAARMFAAAGNMWIAADQPAKAAAALDKAVALPGLTDPQRGEALLDRARAAEALGDYGTARTKLNAASALVSGDPFYWYFSASLAVREGDAATARSAIAKALSMAPQDPTVLFEAGHVAHATGDDDKARSYWRKAAANDPSGPSGKAAAKSIELLGVTPVVKLEPASPK
jgi:tetratricopeptide (TPR) repeat protein